MYNNDYLINQNPIAEPSGIESWLGAATGVVVVLVVLLVLICIALAVLMIVADCKLFTKAGEKWWKAIVPLYSSWIQTKIVGLAWWWFPIYVFFLAFMGTGKNINYVFYWGLILISFNYNYNLAKKFGKSNGFALLCTILPIIGLPILAFGSAKYDKDVKVDENGVFSLKK